ncbi:MAG: type II toxin-antitoxin system RelE/ParE family toxin [Devosia sp.]
MINRRVALSPRAEADLESIVVWISEHGAPLAALAYAARIRSYLAGFAQFAERGSMRDDIAVGFRIIGFERRVTIAFVVRDDRVEIERVFYGGQDWEAALRNESDD